MPLVLPKRKNLSSRPCAGMISLEMGGWQVESVKVTNIGAVMTVIGDRDDRQKRGFNSDHHYDRSQSVGKSVFRQVLEAIH